MKQYEEFEYEFSKIYRRLLRLELLIKIKIIQCSLSVFKDDVMSIYQSFFNNKRIYDKYWNEQKNKNIFLSIKDNKDLIDTIKFSSIIKILTLRHLLHFIFTEEQFRIPAIANKFYVRNDINFRELKRAKTPLINLRNYIAHFDYSNYQKNKNEYLESLLLFEIYIGCSLGKYENIPNNLGYKPSISVIIKKIFELYPELFMKNVPHSDFPHNKDRIIVDMYEDIALLNGWEYRELKSQWDVIREKYRYNKELTAKGSDNLETDDTMQLKFDTSYYD